MKALLSQWIGGSKQGSLSAQQTGAAEKIQDTADAEKQPFVGLMMGFLGMGKNAEVSAEKAAIINNQGESMTGDKSGQIGIFGNKMLSDGSVAIKTKVQTKTAAGKKSVADKKNSDVNKVKNQQVDSPSGNNSKMAATDNQSSGSSVIATGEGAGEEQSNSTHAAQTPTAGAVKNEQASTNITHTKQSENQASLNFSVKNTVSNASAGNKSPNQSEGTQQMAGGELQSKLNNTAQNRSADVTKLTKKMGLNSENGTKESIPNGKNSLESEARLKQTLQKEINDKTVAKKDAQAAMKEFKAMQKESGEAKTRAGQHTSGRGKPQVMAQTAQNAGSSSFKSDFSAAKIMPGKMVFGQSTNPVEMEMDTPQEFKGGADTMFKEIQMNELKSAQLGEAGGRKSFSRQLAQVNRQQLAQQARTQSQETAQWKHHRFMLEDGKAIHVAARTTDGALQLQLSAGNGELGKILHQHLQDIQQHVQQELQIKIDLQLQNSGSHQPDQQAETSNGEQTTQQQTLGGGASSTDNSQPAGSRQVRYFGFNSNEWTA